MSSWTRKTENGRWIARYRAPDGKTRSRTWDRKTDAERWLREELGRRDRGEWVDPKLGKTRLGEWAVTAMASRLHTRASTQARNRSVMDSLVLPMFPEFGLSRITPADIQGWVSGLAGAGYAAETIKKAHALLRMVLATAVDADLLARSPARGVKLPWIERREMRFLTPEELSELLNAVQDRYRLLIKTAAYTGLRFGELAGLRRADVARLRKTITVRRGLVEVSGKLRVEEPKTATDRGHSVVARGGARLPPCRQRQPVRVHSAPSGTAPTVGVPLPRMGTRYAAGGLRGISIP